MSLNTSLIVFLTALPLLPLVLTKASLSLLSSRENEVLKVQLKKYVGAVQMLKREGNQGNDGKTPTA